ncbi:MAG: RNA methyltransferase [Kineosporiaceae bacterium]
MLREGLFLAEGPQAVREAVRAHADAVRAGGSGPVKDLYVTGEAAARYAAEVALAADARVRVSEVTDEVLAAMTDTVSPQGLLAVCRPVDVPLDEFVLAAPRLVAVAAHVRDPGNAGTLVRAADAAGADGVVVSSASVDVYNPKCVRSTAGSLFHLDLTIDADLVEAVGRLREAGLRVLAADGDGDVDLDDLLDEAEVAGAASVLAQPVAWLFGNEAWGLPPELLDLADAVVRVPVHGRAESLNLATAATVCLYASARGQRRARRSEAG